jgi:hypothetical protein
MYLVTLPAQASRNFSEERRNWALQEKKALVAGSSLRMRHATFDWHPDGGWSTCPSHAER